MTIPNKTLFFNFLSCRQLLHLLVVARIVKNSEEKKPAHSADMFPLLYAYFHILDIEKIFK